MAKYMICLPNCAPNYVTLDDILFMNAIASRPSALVHSCPPEDNCRGSLPCLCGDFVPYLVERHCGIDRRLFRVNISVGVCIDTCRRNVTGVPLSDGLHLDNTRVSIRDADDPKCTYYVKPYGCVNVGGGCTLKDGIVIRVLFRLLGGKGGFGALLKGTGKRKKQNANVDSCRTLSGERIRHVRLNELAERQLESTLDSNATKLPSVKEDSTDTDPISQRRDHNKYLKKVKKETKRVSSTVVRGLQNMEEPPPKQPECATDKEGGVERILTECMGFYALGP